MADLNGDRSRSGRPSSLACTECRKKHLRCDASTPICSRCATTNLECQYTASRRGYKRPSKRKADSDLLSSKIGAVHFPSQTSLNASAQQPGHTTIRIAPSISIPEEGSSNDLGGVSHGVGTFDIETSQPRQQPGLTILRLNAPSPSDDEKLINLFYTNFHPAHPFLVPRTFYAAQAYPRYLTQVIKFIGSNYVSSLSSESLRASAALALIDANQKTVHMVQALLLYAVALHGRNEPREALVTLGRAVNLALELGLNRRESTSMHGIHQAVQEESLRRTWWELYVIDGYMAALHHYTGFKSNTVELLTLLPCEETAYTEGNSLLHAPSLESFDARFFADEEVLFSSFCYRIEAVRIIARVLAIASSDDIHHDEVQAIDFALTSWNHYLPIAKAELVTTDGEIDQMIIQAHFLIQCATIFLHFPRSDLLCMLPATAEIVCAQNVAPISPSSAQHTIKVTEASKELSKIAAIPVQARRHTPFFVCGLVLSCIVQLSACSSDARNNLQQNRDRVVLMTGVLRSLSSTWAISRHVLEQLKKVANEVFNTRSRSHPTHSSSAYDSGVDTSSPAFDDSWLELFCTEGTQGLIRSDGETLGPVLTGESFHS